MGAGVIHRQELRIVCRHRRIAEARFDIDAAQTQLFDGAFRFGRGGFRAVGLRIDRSDADQFLVR